MKIFQETRNILNPSDRIYTLAFKSAIFSLSFWAPANLDARRDKQQPVVVRVWEDLKVGGDRCEIHEPQFGVWLCQLPGVAVEQPGQVCHQAGSLRGGARLKEKSPQGQDRVVLVAASSTSSTSVSRDRLGTAGPGSSCHQGAVAGGMSTSTGRNVA